MELFCAELAPGTIVMIPVKYLGRLLTLDDSDMPAVHSNLRKARRCWARLRRVLRAENTAPWICGVFYKATVQAVLLFGAETWNLPPTGMKQLSGFNVRCAYKMALQHTPRRNPDGS